MFTAELYYKYEDSDLNTHYVGSDLFENKNDAIWCYFQNCEPIIGGICWNWNENKKRYECEGLDENWEDDDRYGKKFHAYGIIVEIPNIDISD